MGTDQSGQTVRVTPEVMGMADLVSYQDGAVVSRIILKKGMGTVTVFAFDRDQSLSEHTTPFEALVHVLEGRAEILISGRSHEVGPGQMIVLPAHEPHAVRAIERFKMILTMIRA